MSKRKILVVDDDPIHLTCARELLRADGYEVALQRGAFGATEAVMTHRPDLVLVDVNMPALPGTALVSVLRGRERVRDIPILLYSSNDEAALARDAQRLGIEGWVAKGDPAELRRKVAQTLGRRAGAR